MAGCAVEADRAKLDREASVDVIAGQDEKLNLQALLPAAWREPPSAGDDSGSTAVDRSDRLPRFDRTRALVKVQDGCDFCCAYCIVPRTRGAPRSRPRSEIVDEVRRFADAGYREVVLSGANLGLYRDGAADLVKLIEAIEAVDGIARIRLSSIECTTIERAVVDAMAGSEKLCRYLHVPLQSGDTGVLERMGRRYTPGQYRALVEYAVSRVENLGLGTDIIVGFPGEADDAFANTVALVGDLPFSNLHVFPYSRRPETRADRLAGQLPASVKKSRVRELVELGDRKRTDFAQSFIGRSVSVLVERVTDGVAEGWTGEYLEARVAGPHQENDIVTFTPTMSRKHQLLAESV
jgi:threonylcarbamoyladenosine tRNA methylthiotransferase MtaB